MTGLIQLAEWATALQLHHAPPRIVTRLRLQGASILAAAAASAGARHAEPILAYARGLGPGTLTVAPAIQDLSLEGALLAGSALSMAQDFDDWMLCGHTGHSAVWAAWLGAADLGLGWDDALRAQLAANEILARLGGMCLAGRQNGQAWAFLHAAGGALVRGLLLRLDARTLAHALALALAQSPSVDWRLLAGDGKTLLAARPLLDGWRMADMAAAGVTGPLDLLDGPSDFAATFAQGRPLRGWLTGLPAHDPGRSTWLSWSLAVRMAPGSPWLAAALDAVEEIAEDFLAEEGRPLAASDVLRLDVDVTLPTVAAERLPAAIGPLTVPSLTWSTRRALALRLVVGETGPQTLVREVIERDGDAIAELASRIWLHHDWRLTLRTWSALRTGMGIDRLLAGIGPVPLLAAAGRAAGGLEAGRSLAELPLALAGERLVELEGEQPGELFNRGLERLSDLAARGLQRLVAPSLGLAARRQGPSLDGQDLSRLTIPIPARIRLLQHGGRVREAEVDVAKGTPGRPEAETIEGTRGKLRAALAFARGRPSPADEQLICALLGPGAANRPGETALSPLPDRPADLLRRLRS